MDFFGKKDSEKLAVNHPYDERICVEQIIALKGIMKSIGGNLQNAQESSQIRRSIMECLDYSFSTVTEYLKKKKQHSDAFYATIADFAYIISDLGMIADDFPWSYINLDREQKMANNFFCGRIATQYFNKASNLFKSDADEGARPLFKKATKFDLQIGLAVRIQFTWAICIDKILKKGAPHERSASEITPSDAIDFIEMVAHYDETVKMYALLDEPGEKSEYKFMDDHAKTQIRNCFDLVPQFFMYSKTNNEQLMFKLIKDQDAEIPVEYSWTKHDLSTKQDREAFMYKTGLHKMAWV